MSSGPQFCSILLIKSLLNTGFVGHLHFTGKENKWYNDILVVTLYSQDNRK